MANATATQARAWILKIKTLALKTLAVYGALDRIEEQKYVLIMTLLCIVCIVSALVVRFVTFTLVAAGVQCTRLVCWLIMHTVNG